MLLQAGLTDVLERNLSRSGIAYEIWPGLPGEPMDKDVFRTVEHLLSVQCDGIIALGGGSVLDAAKAVAVLAANPDLPLADMMPVRRSIRVCRLSLSRPLPVPALKRPMFP